MSTQEPSSITLKIAQFIAQFRVLILSIGIAAIVGLIVFVVFVSANSSKLQAAATAFEKADSLYQVYAAQSDEAEKKKAMDAYLVALQALVSDFPNSWHHHQALLLRGNFYFDTGDFAKAKEDYIASAQVRPEVPSAGIALMNAGVAAGEVGQLDEAISLFEKVYSEYKTISPVVPQNLLYLAQKYEQKNDYAKAGGILDRLINEYPDSGWTKNARDLIIKWKKDNKL